MMKRQPSPARAVVIADLVGSRAAPDRRTLHAAVLDVLAAENRAHPPAVSGWRVTVGDEFQAGFSRVGEALLSTLRLRLALWTGRTGVDVRFGVGWGASSPVDDERGLEDGPAWWAAREAITEVESDAARPGLQHRRTAYRVGEGSVPAGAQGPDPALVEAALITRDQTVGALSVRSARLLLGTLEGRSQLEMAGAEQISASAVSQRVRRDGLPAIVAAEQLLGGV